LEGCEVAVKEDLQDWRKMISLFIALSAMDLVSTTYAVGFLGFKELNPIMALTFQFGIVGFWIIKLGFTSMVVYFSKKEFAKDSRVGLWIANLLYIVIVSMNMVALL
jgi:hypothetical protein